MLDNTFGKSLKRGITQEMSKMSVEVCDMAQLLDERYGQDSWIKDCNKIEEEVMELTADFRMLTKSQLPYGHQLDMQRRSQFGHTAPADMGLGIMLEGTAEEINTRNAAADYLAIQIHKELSDVVAVLARMVWKMSRATGIPFGTLMRMYAGMAVDKMQHRQEDPMWDRGGCLKRET